VILAWWGQTVVGRAFAGGIKAVVGQPSAPRPGSPAARLLPGRTTTSNERRSQAGQVRCCIQGPPAAGAAQPQAHPGRLLRSSTSRVRGTCPSWRTRAREGHQAGAGEGLILPVRASRPLGCEARQACVRSRRPASLARFRSSYSQPSESQAPENLAFGVPSWVRGRSFRGWPGLGRAGPRPRASRFGLCRRCRCAQ